MKLQEAEVGFNRDNVLLVGNRSAACGLQTLPVKRLLPAGSKSG